MVKSNKRDQRIEKHWLHGRPNIALFLCRETVSFRQRTQTHTVAQSIGFYPSVFNNSFRSPPSTHCPRGSLLEHWSCQGATGQRCSVTVTSPLSGDTISIFCLPSLCYLEMVTDHLREDFLLLLSTQAGLTKVTFPEFMSRGPTLAQTPACDFTESFTLQGSKAG